MRQPLTLFFSLILIVGLPGVVGSLTLTKLDQARLPNRDLACGSQTVGFWSKLGQTFFLEFGT
jgi:hypothetical protein